MTRLLAGYFYTQFATTLHKLWVAYFMARLAFAEPEWRSREWLVRALRHDISKYRWDESSGFARTIFDLKTTTYGTPEYRALLRKIKPSITRHYARWDHHPEHFERGIADMPPIARAEMICDWAAACKRHPDGNLLSSIEHNQGRFGYSSRDALHFAKLGYTIGAIDRL